MTLPYKRSFSAGRQADQFLTDDMHKIYETVRHISEIPKEGEEPELKLHGALWRDDSSNELKYADKTQNKWIPIFDKKFQITDQMLVEILPSDPVIGQLWIHDGVLYYYDGASWNAIKAASMDDDNPWGIGVFKDFMIVSPLLPVGYKTIQMALDDDFYEHYYKSNTDYKDKNEVLITDKKWTPDWENPFVDPKPEQESLPTHTQYILTDEKYDRLFMDHLLSHDYERVSSICVQYPTKDVVEKMATGIHVNPSKITNVTRRLFKVDKKNPTIHVSALNTEFYGYRTGEYGGDILRQSDNVDSGDYIISEDNIILNYKAAQNYDYVLALTWHFGWIRDTGRERVISSGSIATGYYINNLQTPINVFVDGLKLEEQYYTTDASENSVRITDKNLKPQEQQVDFLSSIKKEYGYIRETTLDNYGIIKPHTDFRKLLVFVNGMVMSPTLDGLVYKDNDVILVPKAKVNMPWSILELDSDDNASSMYMLEGVVENAHMDASIAYSTVTDDSDLKVDKSKLKDTTSSDRKDLEVTAATYDKDTEPKIYYSPGLIKQKDNIVLFINGFLIPHSEIIRDNAMNSLTIKKGLTAGDHYIILRDPDNRLYDDLKLLPAFDVGALDNALIYLNGQLLSDMTPVRELGNESSLSKSSLSHNEVKFFIPDASVVTDGTVKIYDQYSQKWVDATKDESAAVMKICSSYSLGLSSIQMNISYTGQDKFNIYAFKYANRAVDTLKIGTAEILKENNPDNSYYQLGYSFIQGRNQVNLFCNGVKLTNGVDFVEQYSGNVIRITNPKWLDQGYTFTYIIEPLENGNTTAAQFVTLENDDALGANVYRIPDDNDASLYPGRLTVYLNGIRLPKDSWNILSNKTIMLRKLIWPTISTAAQTYPEQTYILDKNEHGKKADGREITITHASPDRVVVEIRQEFERQEKTFLYPGEISEFSIEQYGLPNTIFETQDEVLVYVNGVFTGLTRRNSDAYRLDRNKECFTILNSGVLDMLNSDPLWNILRRNDYMYTAWKIKNNASEYKSDIENYITLVWR